MSTNNENAANEQRYCDEHYPNANIRIIPDISYVTRSYKTAWAEAEYIMSSQESFPIRKKNGQKYISLGYYPVSLKQGWFPSTKGMWYGHRIEYAKQIDKVMSASLIYSQMNSSDYEIPFGKFVSVGQVCSDILIKNEDMSFVRDYFKHICGNYRLN